MKQTITITLPSDIKKELDTVSSKDGVSRSNIITQSLRDYLFIRRYRSLRKKMTAKARAQGIYTDSDVFDRVS